MLAIAPKIELRTTFEGLIFVLALNRETREEASQNRITEMGGGELRMMHRPRQIPCKFPANSLPSRENPLFMRVPPTNFFLRE